MPVDTSIYRSQQRSPLSDLGTLAGIANAVNQNRLFQQQFGANIATSQAVKQATNPLTGETDWGRAAGIISQGPAAYNLPQFMGQVQEQKQRQVGLQKSEFELADQRLNALRSALVSVVSNPQAGPNDVINAASKLVAQGVITPKMAATQLAGMPRDSEGIRKWVTQQLIDTMDAQQKVAALYGTPQMVEGVDPRTGAPVKRPVSVSPITGVRDLAMGGPGGGPGTFQTGLAPGQSQAMEGSAKAWQTLRDDVGQSAERVFTLEEALKALKTAPTGKGSTWQNDLRSYAITLGMTEDPNVKDEVAAFDKANKYLTQYAMRQSAQLGTGTDQKLATALTGNASTEISKLAAEDVVKANLALERMKQAQAFMFEESGELPGQFSKWASKWNREVDPRAFMVDLVGPKERKKIIDSLKGPSRQRFLNGVRMAIDSGLISPEAFGGQGQ